MKEVLVSIIVPIYNVEKYLERCLLSIKNQEYSNIEVIMVNDGSKDSSREIAERFANIDSRFKLKDKENGGLSSGRNYGMKYVTGEYVSFVDSDDFLSKNYVSRLLNAFDENTDIVIADYAIFNTANRKSYLHGPQYKVGNYSNKEEKKELVNALLSGCPVMSVWKNMYRVSFLKNNNLQFVSERLVYAEDKLFNVEAYTLANCVKIISDIVFYHLVIPGSLSQGYRKNYFEMSKELYFRIEALLQKYYDEAFVINYRAKLPNIIGASMFALCKCTSIEAKYNMRTILDDEIVKKTYKMKYKKRGYFRYWILYKIGSLNSAGLLVFVAKGMIICNPIYRSLQRKKEYKALD